MRSLMLVVFTLLLLVLAGCQGPASPGTRPETVVPSLEGQVLFADRKTQAELSDAAIAATVSLINSRTNVTESTTLTNHEGKFSLRFSGRFRPDRTAVYYMEAVKGLDSNRPGSNALRLRTIARFQHGGWTSITSAIPGMGIFLTPGTTALSIGAALRSRTSRPVEFSSLIGRLLRGTTDEYTPVPNLTQADFLALRGLVNQILTDDRDPVACIGLAESDSWARSDLGLFIASLSPRSGNSGTMVTITGRGFSPNPANNRVAFNGVSASVGSASATGLTVTVPSGATTGTLTIQVGNLTVLGPTFEVR